MSLLVQAGCHLAPVHGEPSQTPPAAAAEVTALPSAPGEPAAAPTTTTDSSVRQTLDAIRQLLDLGQDEAAAARLDPLVASRQGGKPALTLQRSMREDPLVLHGREHFAYSVVAGDTLAVIAQRFLNDRDQFWSLARYNGIKVPRQLIAGQTLRVPGRARIDTPPAVVAAAAPLIVVVADGDDEAAAERADRERKDGVERASRAARLAMTRRDGCAALAAWNQVLRVEPYHREAVQQRDKALAIKPRAPAGKC